MNMSKMIFIAFVLVPTSGYFKCGNDLSKAVQRWKTGTVQTSLWTARGKTHVALKSKALAHWKTELNVEVCFRKLLKVYEFLMVFN